jgi:predicted pyridoxine 5'-phosphate oxidase superfamily flavin-nucleotide-binding protein
MSMYHDGQRQLQDRYSGRAVADRLEQHRLHRTFTDDDRAFIETAPFFFLATAWQDSVDCSMKGGMPGFVRVTAPNEIAWPDYDGNRMYRSLGNILKNPAVGLLTSSSSTPRAHGCVSRAGRAWMKARKPLQDYRERNG